MCLQVLEAERSVYEGKLESERRRVVEKENEKQERDAKIAKLEEELKELVDSLNTLQVANREIQDTLNTTTADLKTKTFELKQLGKVSDFTLVPEFVKWASFF